MHGDLFPRAAACLTPIGGLFRALSGALGVAVVLCTATWSAADSSAVIISDPADHVAGSPGALKPAGGAPASKALQDTIWIADFPFETGACNSMGWTHYDHRILSDGTNFWTVDNRYNQVGAFAGKAGVLSHHDLCWSQDGYGNEWDYSIVLNYKDGASLEFDYINTAEPGLFDYFSVEADAFGASEDICNNSPDPSRTPASFRETLLVVPVASTFPGSLHFGPIPLPQYGGGGAVIHEVYLRFVSSDQESDADGLNSSGPFQAALAIDNVSMTGPLAYTETFEGVLNANLTMLNTAPSKPIGDWARLYSHVTDNDRMTENVTCSWIFTNPATVAYFPDMAFGPSQSRVVNWLDNVLVSPWISLASTPTFDGTVLSFRAFPGQRYSESKIIQGWKVRSKRVVLNTDTPDPVDLTVCLSPWQLVDGTYFALDSWSWQTQVLGLSEIIPADATEIQVQTRVTDAQYLAGEPAPARLNTGPGPYLDRIRIGRGLGIGKASGGGIGPFLTAWTGLRSQAQDAFPTVQNAVTPGQHFSPDGSNRFGSCAFSAAGDLGINSPGSQALITSDSIYVLARDMRNAGGVTSVKFYGAITSGPHSGKAPCPYAVGGNGFFEVSADNVRNSQGAVIAEKWFVDLDDTYFRGGDVMKYFWAATDAAGGFTSLPNQMTALPTSVAAAEVTTAGLYEVSYLPTIAWSPAYLARIQGSGCGDLDPTPTEIANSTQANCILYVNAFTERRSISRTSFMYTLDALGYRGHYDVYDMLSYGNVNNQLGSRANVGQASGYSLIVQDSERRLWATLPAGLSTNFKVNQAQWYRDYLSIGAVGFAGQASLWLIGENVAFENRTNALLTTDCGIGISRDDQAIQQSPRVTGHNNFTFASGAVATFAGDNFALRGASPLRRFDGLTPGGGGVSTHRYTNTQGNSYETSAVVMNKNSVLHWNSIVCGFPWFDIMDPHAAVPSPPPGQHEKALAIKILAGVLPAGCLRGLNPADGEEPGVPPATALHPSVPNPFNPSTVISFDLAVGGHVRLRIFNVAGALVRSLVDAHLGPSAQRIIWDGRDGSNTALASGVYFIRLDAPDQTFTQKTVLLR